MSISALEIEAPLIEGVSLSEDTLTADLRDGRTISVPLAWFPRLMHSSPKERENWRLIGSGEGIHWDEIDEDISAKGLLLGKSANESPESFKQWLKARKQS